MKRGTGTATNSGCALALIQDIAEPVPVFISPPVNGNFGTPMPSSPVVVELTPPGRGAVATLLVEGAAALQTVGRHFRPNGKLPLEGCQADRLVFGRFGSEPAEEVVVRLRSQQSVEVHCHGGHAAIERIRQLLATEGCRPLAWQAWTLERLTRPHCVCGVHRPVQDTNGADGRHSPGTVSGCAPPGGRLRSAGPGPSGDRDRQDATRRPSFSDRRRPAPGRIVADRSGGPS